MAAKLGLRTGIVSAVGDDFDRSIERVVAGVSVEKPVRKDLIEDRAPNPWFMK